MNLINVREGMINVLLQQVDARDVLIGQLQAENAELKKKLEPVTPAAAPATEAAPATA